MKKYTLVITCVIGIFLIISCKNKSDDNNPTAISDYSTILDNIAKNIILETYKSLNNEAIALNVATKELENNKTLNNLNLVKVAWVKARSPWEQSESFLFGPVDQEGIDPSLDSWPVNITDLKGVLSSNNSLTVSFLSNQSGNLKGFHTIEFLLWGEDGSKKIGDFTAREFEYLAAASGALALDATKLYDLWSPSAGNFVDKVANAGVSGNKIYVSQKAALQQIVNGMIAITDEVGNGKINDPFVQQDLSLEESRFSANSKADFSDNIRSIKNIYIGKFEAFGNEKSISNIIKEKKLILDTKVILEINAAVEAIESIPNTFSDAVFNSKTAVSNAQISVRTLQTTLEAEVLPIISNL